MLSVIDLKISMRETRERGGDLLPLVPVAEEGGPVMLRARRAFLLADELKGYRHSRWQIITP